MAIKLNPIQTSRRRVPTEAIIQTLGQSPVAQGIETAGNVLGKAIQRRAELKRQAQQVDAIAKATGVDLKGISDPALAASIGKSVGDYRSEELRARQSNTIRSEESEANRDLRREQMVATNALRESMADNSLDFRSANLDLRRESAKNALVARFNAEASIKKAQQSIDSANLVRDLAQSGNPIGAAAIPTISARMSFEVGALSEADKAPFGGSRAIFSRLNQALKQMKDGKLTDENRQFIIGLSDLFEKTAHRNMDNLAKQRASQYSRKSNMFNESELYDIFRPSFDNGLSDLIDEGLVTE